MSLKVLLKKKSSLEMTDINQLKCLLTKNNRPRRNIQDSQLLKMQTTYSKQHKAHGSRKLFSSPRKVFSWKRKPPR